LNELTGPEPIRRVGETVFAFGTNRRKVAAIHRTEPRPNIITTPIAPATTEVIGSIVSGPRYANTDGKKLMIVPPWN
jgi:hypothetical protein